MNRKKSIRRKRSMNRRKSMIRKKSLNRKKSIGRKRSLNRKKSIGRKRSIRRKRSLRNKKQRGGKPKVDSKSTSEEFYQDAVRRIKHEEGSEDRAEVYREIFDDHSGDDTEIVPGSSLKRGTYWKTMSDLGSKWDLKTVKVEMEWRESYRALINENIKNAGRIFLTPERSKNTLIYSIKEAEITYQHLMTYIEGLAGMGETVSRGLSDICTEIYKNIAKYVGHDLEKLDEREFLRHDLEKLDEREFFSLAKDIAEFFLFKKWITERGAKGKYVNRHLTMVTGRPGQYSTPKVHSWPDMKNIFLPSLDEFVRLAREQYKIFRDLEVRKLIKQGDEIMKQTHRAELALKQYKKALMFDPENATIEAKIAEAKEQAKRNKVDVAELRGQLDAVPVRERNR